MFIITITLQFNQFKTERPATASKHPITKPNHTAQGRERKWLSPLEELLQR